MAAVPENATEALFEQLCSRSGASGGQAVVTGLSLDRALELLELPPQDEYDVSDDLSYEQFRTAVLKSARDQDPSLVGLRWSMLSDTEEAFKLDVPRRHSTDGGRQRRQGLGKDPLHGEGHPDPSMPLRHGAITRSLSESDKAVVRKHGKLRSATEIGDWLADVAKSLAAGGAAGAVAKTVIAPLDRTKIVFQTSSRPFSLRAMYGQLVLMVREGGAASLWRGHSATLARVVPYAAIQFVSFDQYKMLLLPSDSDTLSHGRRLLAGSMAGATSVCCTYPLDLVRARMAVQGSQLYGMRTNFRLLVHEEGWRGLFRGLSPTLLGILPYAGLAFFTFETLKQGVAQYGGRDDVTAIERLACGSIAGLCAQSATYPLDVVRRRMQTDGLIDVDVVRSTTGRRCSAREPLPRRNTAIMQTLQGVLRSEGVKGLYKGVTINWIKGPIAVAISFSTFDVVKNMLGVEKAGHG